jgi:hypothetical protein
MNELPTLLEYFKDHLGFIVKPNVSSFGYQTFFIDLSSLKLRLSHQTPVIWVKNSDVEGIKDYQLLQSLQDVIREQKWGNQTVIVFLDRKGESLLKYTANPLNNMVVIGKDEQDQIQDSRRPTGELIDTVSAQISISLLSPYETTSPVTGSRFFGRELELSRILGNPDTNYLILGIRRIGKTSLLREAERILSDNEDQTRVVYLDCSDLMSTNDYIREVVRRLEPHELPRLELQKYVFYFPNFLERMHLRHKAKLIFILDEIDNLLISQRGNSELFQMLRASSNKGACQYIIAGFREAQREQYLLDSPMFNFAQPIRLNEFTIQQARDLIITPMENLGVRFRNKEDVVGRIYKETAGHPNLIQYYCMILLRQIDQAGVREITPDNLIGIYTDEGFKGHLLSSFMENTRNREKAVVYAALLGSPGKNLLRSFSESIIDASLHKSGIAMKQLDIEEACNLLILAGILHRKDSDYSFTSPVFANVLQHSHDLGYLLNKVKEEGI